MHRYGKRIFSTIFTLIILLSPALPLLAAEDGTDIFSGYYSRDREDGKAAEIAGVSKYIKFYPDKLVVMIYIPYDYSQTLSSTVIHAALKDIKSRIGPESYSKGKFGELTELSVAHVEVYRPMGDDQLEFECDGTAPCRARLEGDTMELRKAGMVSDHISGYNRVTD